MGRLVVTKESFVVQELELPDEGDGGGIVFLGRSESNDICLPSLRVSKRHASIQRRQGHAYLTDLGSTNGTWVNGERVPPYREFELFDGDRITIEPYTIRCELPLQRPGGAPPPAESEETLRRGAKTIKADTGRYDDDMVVVLQGGTAVQVLPLGGGNVKIGRAATDNFRIETGGPATTHLRIFRAGGKYFAAVVCDEVVASKDGRALTRQTGPVELHHGESVELGGYAFQGMFASEIGAQAGARRGRAPRPARARKRPRHDTEMLLRGAGDLLEELGIDVPPGGLSHPQPVPAAGPGTTQAVAPAPAQPLAPPPPPPSAAVPPPAAVAPRAAAAPRPPVTGPRVGAPPPFSPPSMPSPAPVPVPASPASDESAAYLVEPVSSASVRPGRRRGARGVVLAAIVGLALLGAWFVGRDPEAARRLLARVTGSAPNAVKTDEGRAQPRRDEAAGTAGRARTERAPAGGGEGRVAAQPPEPAAAVAVTQGESEPREPAQEREEASGTPAGPDERQEVAGTSAPATAGHAEARTGSEGERERTGQPASAATAPPGESADASASAGERPGVVAEAETEGTEETGAVGSARGAEPAPAVASTGGEPEVEGGESPVGETAAGPGAPETSESEAGSSAAPEAEGLAGTGPSPQATGTAPGATTAESTEAGAESVSQGASEPGAAAAEAAEGAVAATPAETNPGGGPAVPSESGESEIAEAAVEATERVSRAVDEAARERGASSAGDGEPAARAVAERGAPEGESAVEQAPASESASAAGVEAEGSEPIARSQPGTEAGEPEELSADALAALVLERVLPLEEAVEQAPVAASDGEVRAVLERSAAALEAAVAGAPPPASPEILRALERARRAYERARAVRRK
ncbi:MAG: FHA domain-containing protein [Planctomycetota bacterium]|nr:MAG: FHA domain-containing protein [Planctomycetota bacterium]